MSDEGYGRRRFLYRTGVAVTAGALAGCAGGNDTGDNQTATETGEGGGTTTTAMATDTPTATDTETATAAGTTETGTTDATATTPGASPLTEPAPQAVDEFLDDAEFYNGNMVVGVPFVGVGASDANIGFDPAAIKVDPGTEVTWQWVGGEKRHSVVSRTIEDGEQLFDSSPPQVGEGTTFQYTFTSPGIYRYICGVHRLQGARGVVVVRPGVDVGGTETG